MRIRVRTQTPSTVDMAIAAVATASFIAWSLTVGMMVIAVTAGFPAGNQQFVTIAITGGGASSETTFLRGDTNRDGAVGLTDAFYTLLHLFQSGPAPYCDDAADADDSGDLNTTDPVFTLQALFMGGGQFPPPGREIPGVDPTADALDCDVCGDTICAPEKGESCAVCAADCCTGDTTPPAAPTGLTARPISAHQIDLDWIASRDSESGVSHYRVYRDGTRLGATPAVNSFVDGGVAEKTTYRYQVAAVNGVGLESGRSAEISVTTPSDKFSFGAAGDHNNNESTRNDLANIKTSGVDFYVALGDLQIEEEKPESDWCDLVKSKVGDTFPFELISGNHDRLARSDPDSSDEPQGFIRNYARCLPDRMNSVGIYGEQYYFDYENLARFILIAPSIELIDKDGEVTDWEYPADGKNYQWVAAAIDDARQKGIPWVIVGMHKTCISSGVKTSCAPGKALYQMLVSKKVDLILHGHDHTYQRSKQLTCVEIGSYDASCVADSGSDGQYRKGAGTVIVVSGTMGQGHYNINESDSERPYFAKVMGKNIDTSHGFTKYTVSSTELSGEFVREFMGEAGFSDSFRITAD